MPSTVHHPRRHPNIAISGVPGTGKTSLAQRLRFRFPHLKRIDMGTEAQERGCREEYDSLLETWVVDEDKLVESLTPSLLSGGNIIDWIHADMWSSPFPSSTSSTTTTTSATKQQQQNQPPIIDLVITLRTNNTILYDRLTLRKYPPVKISQNIDAEIMNEIGCENEDAFGEGNNDAFVNEGVFKPDGHKAGNYNDNATTKSAHAKAGTTLVQLQSDNEEDAKANVEAIGRWMNRWAVEGAGGSLAVAWAPSVDGRMGSLGSGSGMGTGIGVAR